MPAAVTLCATMAAALPGVTIVAEITLINAPQKRSLGFKPFLAADAATGISGTLMPHSRGRRSPLSLTCALCWPVGRWPGRQANFRRCIKPAGAL